MKLNSSFLGIQWEISPDFKKEGFLKVHLSAEKKLEIQRNEELAKIQTVFDPDKIDYDFSIDWWERRTKIANDLCASPGNLKIYYLTEPVKKESELIDYNKVNLKWFNQIPDMDCIYITGKKEFYRFKVDKKDHRINILNFRVTGGTEEEPYIWYDCYSIILTHGMLTEFPGMDKALAEKFIKYLLYVELGEIKLEIVKPNQKIRYGKSGDDKILNETNCKNVYLVTTNWNKITVVKGEFKVHGHLRVQPYGEGRSLYKLIWIEEYKKGGYVRGADRLSHQSNSD